MRQSILPFLAQDAGSGIPQRRITPYGGRNPKTLNPPPCHANSRLPNPQFGHAMPRRPLKAQSRQARQSSNRFTKERNLIRKTLAYRQYHDKILYYSILIPKASSRATLEGIWVPFLHKVSGGMVRGAKGRVSGLGFFLPPTLLGQARIAGYNRVWGYRDLRVTKPKPIFSAPVSCMQPAKQD